MALTVAPLRRLQSPMLWLLLVAALLRGAAILAESAHLAEDPDDYRAVAQELLAHRTLAIGGRPTAYRPPLYPLVLAGWGSLFGLEPLSIGILQLLLGVATVALVVLVGRQWGLAGAAYLAGILVACDPILIHQTSQVMTETLATLLATASLAALAVARQRDTIRAGFFAGLVLALAALCRPTFLLWGLAAAIGLAVWRSPQVASSAPSLFRGRLLGVACLAGLALGLAPWGLRNLVQLGRPIVTTTHGGYTLLLANNDDFYRYLRRGRWGDVWTSEALVRHWQAEVVRQAANTELDRDRLAYQLAWTEIRQQPAMFAYACLVRVGRFWSLVPHRVAGSETGLRQALRWTVGLGYAIELLLAVVGVAALLSTRGEPACRWWGVLLIACLTGAHLVYWTDMRMRAPAMPAVCLLAAVGLAQFGHWQASRKPL